MLLLEVRREVVQLLEQLGLHQPLQDELLLVLDDLDGVLAASAQVDAADDLAEGALTQVAHDLVVDALRRVQDLVLSQDVFAARAEDLLLLALLFAEGVRELVDSLAKATEAAQILPVLGAFLLFGDFLLRSRAAYVVLAIASAGLLLHLLFGASVLIQTLVGVLQATRQLAETVLVVRALLHGQWRGPLDCF